MSNALAIPDYIKQLFNTGHNEDLTTGVGTPMRVISTRGKIFRIVDKGVETIVQGTDGRPAQFITGIIVRASPVLSRQFYVDAYREGSDNPPDCWSLDGLKPDISVRAKQNDVCATCQNNAWGSKNVDGSKGKACAETRRLAFVPLWELERLNDPDYAPCLFRVPPGSLGELKGYAEKLTKVGLPYAAVTTVISFDTEATFKLLFAPDVFLPQAVAPLIAQMASSDEVTKLLALSENDIRLPPSQVHDEITHQPEPAPAPQPVPPPPAPEPAPAPTPAPAQAATKPAGKGKGKQQGAPVTATTSPAPNGGAGKVSNLGGGALAGLMTGLGVPTPAAQQAKPAEASGPVIEGQSSEVGDEAPEDGPDEGEAQASSGAPGGLSSLISAALRGQ